MGPRLHPLYGIGGQFMEFVPFIGADECICDMTFFAFSRVLHERTKYLRFGVDHTT